jgi:hypothetical protein
MILVSSLSANRELIGRGCGESVLPALSLAAFTRPGKPEAGHFSLCSCPADATGPVLRRTHDVFSPTTLDQVAIGAPIMTILRSGGSSTCSRNAMEGRD